jgi:hypothetical protein
MRRCSTCPTSPAAGAPIDAVRMGTTVATNALLERRGEPTAAGRDAGFADALLIGTQQRPDLFELDIRLPPPLYARSDRGRRAHRTPTGRCCSRWTRPRSRPSSRRRARAASEQWPSSCCTATAIRCTSARRPHSRGRRLRRRCRSRTRSARCRDWCRAATPRWRTPTCRRVLARYVRGSARRCAGTAAPCCSCRATAACAEAERFRGAGQRAVRTRRRGGRHGGGGTAGRQRAAHRLRHGRHVHRRLPLRG